MRNLLGKVLLAGSLLTAVVLTPARADEVAESSTGVKFQSPLSAFGKSFTLLGTGVRKKFIVKVYAMALYAESGEGKKAYASSGEHGAAWIAKGSFDKLAILHFVRDVESEKMRSAYTETLADELADSAPADIRTAAQQFIAMFDHDAKSGGEVWVHTSGDGTVTVDQAGQKKSMKVPPALVRSIWNIWLGKKPISEDLKTGLVSGVDSLK